MIDYKTSGEKKTKSLGPKARWRVLRFDNNVKKGKSDKLDLNKVNNFCSVKRMKSWAPEWGNIYANHISNKRLEFRKYKELLKQQLKKQTIQLENEQILDSKPGKFAHEKWKEVHYY